MIPRKIQLLLVISFVISTSSLFLLADARSVEPDPMRQVIRDLQSAIERNDFSTMSKYGSKSELLYWAICNSDVSVNYSVEKMLAKLSDKSRNAKIRVYEKSDGGLIETVGWLGEETYLYFQFTRNGNDWKWLGVCESKTRSIDFRPR